MVFTFEKSLSILYGSAPEESGESEVQAPTASPVEPLLFFPPLPFFSHPPHPPHPPHPSLFLHPSSCTAFLRSVALSVFVVPSFQRAGSEERRVGKGGECGDLEYWQIKKA